ncbi:putative very-long-chain enoyl-CoA reductase [Paratrimastix pyriformis]|uniref:Very-long-chain enoyl-CoA reductase n=1 Tax=Paratrimastix pyriformis TaxID=342808 RepID=A0ABQ8UJM7_9EUKA|nr:putative very-long-chain enoyl-CoA reductase [Paratrimastix pyriformis]
MAAAGGSNAITEPLLQLCIVRGTKEVQLSIAPTQTVADLKWRIQREAFKVPFKRQRLTLADGAPAAAHQQQPGGKPPKPVVVGPNHVALGRVAGLRSGSRVAVKDLGPQMDYRAVFLAEYAGPLAIVPIVALVRPWVYGPALTAAHPLVLAQIVGLLCWVLHYTKRLLESVFLHSFSHSTMPLFNLAKNCTYYWGAAVMVGYFLMHPLYTAPRPGASPWARPCGCHQHLASLRRRPIPGLSATEAAHAHPVPTMGLFRWVVCPNYTAEILGWAAFNLMTSTLAGMLFMVAGAAQMYQWAQGKRRRYLDEHPAYPRHRPCIFPPCF